MSLEDWIKSIDAQRASDRDAHAVMTEQEFRAWVTKQCGFPERAPAPDELRDEWINDADAGSGEGGDE